MKEIKREPTAKVSVKKSLLKKYKVDGADVYFLKNGTEFEIELFNPLQETILCKLTFNGKKVDGEGLILRPGERVFLERYLENNKKFLFETYEVEDSDEAKEAVEKNGDIIVTFHRETQTIIYDRDYWSTPTVFYYDTNAEPNWKQDFFMTSGTGTVTVTSNDASSITLDGCTATSSTTYINDANTWNCSTNNLTATTTASGPNLRSFETGRVETGSNSDQAFTYVNKDFCYQSFHMTEFKLMPESQKCTTVEDLKIRKYCTQCGKKAKPKDNFCSACGTKLE